MENESKNKISRRLTALRIILLALLLAVYAAMPVYAWFARNRLGAGVAKIDDPTSIYINAANKEDIRYLYMSGIDLEAASATHPTLANKKYKDFIFCVRGSDVNAYKLQLAYTTNNQFEFELFHATKAASGEAPNDAFVVVPYETHPDRTSQDYYVSAAMGTPIAGHFLNRLTPSDEILAISDTSNDYERMTYGTYGDTAGHVNKYAYPLYWQTDNAIDTESDENGEFCDYYILRVIWENTRRNDKETDIIYITARNVTTN